jgi:hypothetical protein
VGNSVEPVSQEVAAPKRAGLAHQYEECGLKGIVNIVRILQQLPADTEHHWAVPRDERFERGFITSTHKAFEKLALGQSNRSPVAKQPPELVDQCPTIATAAPGHELASQSAHFFGHDIALTLGA